MPNNAFFHPSADLAVALPRQTEKVQQSTELLVVQTRGNLLIHKKPIGVCRSHQDCAHPLPLSMPPLSLPVALDKFQDGLRPLGKEMNAFPIWARQAFLHQEPVFPEPLRQHAA